MNYSNLTAEQQMVAEAKKFVNKKQRELTQAEYDALSTEEKNNGTLYFVIDSENPLIDSYTKSEVDTLLEITSENFDNKVEDIYDVLSETNTRNILKVELDSNVQDGIYYNTYYDGNGDFEKLEIFGTAEKTVSLKVGQVSLKKDCTYTLKGCPAGGSLGSYVMGMGQSGTWLDTGEGAVALADNNKDADISIVIVKNFSIPESEPLIFYPQVSYGVNTSTEYSQYAMTNKELTDNKVDKVTGKGLSTNDYTDADKTAVSSLGTASTKNVGIANGVAELDSSGKVPSAQLPSYVDDVIEGYYNPSTDRFYEESTFTTLIPPEDSKSWVDVASNKSYRWTGSVYVRVDEGVQLGETSSTAYRGDRGKTAYDHSQATGNPHGTTKSDIGLGNVDNTSDLNKPISTAVQNALNNKLDKYKTITTATDLNTILESGFYSIPNGCTNIPAMSGRGKATLIVIGHPYGASSGQILQILVNQLNVNGTDKMYYRIGTIGTQTASFLDWNRILNLDDIPTIASAIKQWSTGSYTIDLYGIDSPTTYYTASSTYSGKRYLDVATGKMYTCVQTGSSTYTWQQAPVNLQLKSDINASAIEDLQNKIEARTAKVYSFHISDSESSPSSKVTYLDDAVGMTPAYMNYSTGKFNYGSWGDIWFVKECKPCILGQDGKVQKYLNPNDYTKDIDGNTVTIDSTLTGANVMIEFPKIWYKVTPDSNDAYSGTVSISPVKIDEGYKDYAYIDYQGNHKEHFYMPAYNGSLINNIMRSVSGATISKTLNAQTEINYCKANSSGWYTEDAGSIMLINFLLILMGKSTDTQTVYGQGLHTGGTEAINNGFTTGVHNDKGLFYGTNSGTIASDSYGNAVKVFGIENYWGLQWRRYAGDINDKGTRKIKLCYGNEDGSASFDYNIDGSGYVNVGATPSGTNGGYISKMKFTHDGMYSQVLSGSSSTYYCDGQWFNNSQINYALRGGDSRNGLRCGALYVSLNDASGYAWWDAGVALEYK